MNAKTRLITIAGVGAAVVLGLGVTIGWAATSGSGPDGRYGSMMGGNDDRGSGSMGSMMSMGMMGMGDGNASSMHDGDSMPMDADDMRDMHGNSDGQMPMDADDMRDMHGDDVDVDKMIAACREAADSTSRTRSNGGMMNPGSGMMGEGSGMMDGTR